MKPEKMIGKKVSIVNKESSYVGHWGFIKIWDGRWFHIGGGSISSEHGEITPVFERDEFKIMSK
ncbi:hypothetical protein [Paenibacillus tianjinensis]|uniref:Uncharacterized protein n=1 Tax=Paenibacillus tianjinensis TaxID=2810347 RepID=A0ABX7L5T6_9BACL|nr:hypothetical protein [Paenibacillus tianjinensis]QSF43485.1 hypothetical protein JRJ22_19670 [Paenibacillus tianjinensis]